MGSLGLHTLVSDCLTDISWYQDLYIYYAKADVGSDRKSLPALITSLNSAACPSMEDLVEILRFEPRDQTKANEL